LLHLRLVLDLLELNQFFAKASKCVFAVDKVDYLGHVVTPQGVTPDPDKIQAIIDSTAPKTLTVLRGFLGLTGFYRRFVRNYATIASPLTDLLSSTKFSWNTSANTTFTTLKEKMTITSVLSLPDFTKLFVLEIDAASIPIGAVMSQDGHPIVLFSKKMCNRMQSASIYVREMFAITESINKWRQYLVGRHFHIYTNQKSLKNLVAQTIQTPKQQKWASKLQGFSFDIFYKPRKSNLVADALSRKQTDLSAEPQLLSLSSAIPSIISKLHEYYNSDKEGHSLLFKISQDTDPAQHYTIRDGLV